MSVVKWWNFYISMKFKNKIVQFKSRFIEFRKRERRLSFGNEFPDKTFYIISYDYDTQGLFAIVKSVLSHIMYATEKGWLPVVDLKNYNCQYQEKGKNAWELFFLQPCDYSLEDIRHCKNAIRSYYGMYPYNRYDFYVNILDIPDECARIARVYKQYINPQPKLQEHMDKMLCYLQIDNKTLGVLCRGTDYLKRKPQFHPRQPEPCDVINDAKAMMKERGYQSVFVATEDNSVLDMFKVEFGSKLRYIDQPRLDLTRSQQYLSDIPMESTTRQQIGVDYYTALYVLSRCPAILAGRTAGTLGAVFMSDGFEWSKFYELGSYE